MSRNWLKTPFRVCFIVVAIALATSGAVNRSVNYSPSAGSLELAQSATENERLKKRELAIRAYISANRLRTEKDYDGALAAAYNSLKLSREIKYEHLEQEALRLIAAIHQQLGDNFVVAKLMMAYMQRLFEQLARLGIKEYYGQAATLEMEILQVDEAYMFFSLESSLLSNLLAKFHKQLAEEFEEEQDEDTPQEMKKVLSDFKAKFERVSLKLADATKARNARQFMNTFVELCQLIEKFTDVRAKHESDPDEEEIAIRKRLMKAFTQTAKAYASKDIHKLRSAYNAMLEPFDEMMKKDEGVGLEESMKEGLARGVSELQQAIDDGGQELFKQLFMAQSERNVLNAYLLHFMKVDRSIEPVFKRHGYITLSDLDQYREDLLVAAESVKKELSAEGEIEISKIPTILPTAGFTLSDNLLAISSCFTSEGEWLHNGNPTLLLTAHQEVSGLMDEARNLEKLMGIHSNYSQSRLLIREALIFSDEGNTQESMSYLHKALSNFQKRGDGELTWHIYFMMGLLNKREGRFTEAIGNFKDAVSVIERTRSSFRAENIRSLVFEDKLFVHEFLLDMLIRVKQNAEALSYIEKAKARVLLDRLLDPRMKIIPNLKTAAAKKVQSALEKTIELQEARRRNEAKLDQQELNTLNDKAKSEQEKYVSALEELRYSNPEFASIITGETLSPTEIQRLLDNDTVILEYFVGAEKIYIFVINNSGPIEVAISNVKHRDIETKIDSLRNQIDVETRNLSPIAQELYGLLVRPVEQWIAGKRLCIVPHGAVHFLPFQALMRGNKYLIQDHQIFYSPSSSVLKHAFGKRRDGFSNICIIGNPTGNLSSAEEEAREVATLFPVSKVFLRQDAVIAKVMGAIGDADVLHFATHGSLNKENPLFSHLTLANGEILNVADIYGGCGSFRATPKMK